MHFYDEILSLNLGSFKYIRYIYIITTKFVEFYDTSIGFYKKNMVRYVQSLLRVAFVRDKGRTDSEYDTKLTTVKRKEIKK